MRKDQRGVVSMEMVLVFLAFFTLVFAIFDVSRLAITVVSLRTLGSETARALIVGCYNQKAAYKQSPTICTANPLTVTQQKTIAPYLFYGKIADYPTISGPVATGAVGSGNLAITLSKPFAPMISLLPIPYPTTLTVAINLPF